MAIQNILVQKATKIPVNFTLLKSYLKDNFSENNQEIEKLVKSATSTVEKYTQRSLVRQTRKMILTGEDLKDEVVLEFPPIIQINSIVGVLPGGSEEVQDPSTYYIMENYLYLNFSLYYNLIEIEYECGYADVRDIPDDLQTAVMRITANLYSIKSDLSDRPISKLDGTKDILNEHKIIYLG